LKKKPFGIQLQKYTATAIKEKQCIFSHSDVAISLVNYTMKIALFFAIQTEVSLDKEMVNAPIFLK